MMDEKLGFDLEAIAQEVISELTKVQYGT